jgi:hypothetical protein
MIAKTGDRIRFTYPKTPQLNCDLTVVRTDGTRPDDFVYFDDETHTKQKHLGYFALQGGLFQDQRARCFCCGDLVSVPAVRWRGAVGGSLYFHPDCATDFAQQLLETPSYRSRRRQSVAWGDGRRTKASKTKED